MLTGANGSGKTTLLLIAAGILSPSQGVVSFNQQNVADIALRNQIGISASKVNLPGFFTATDMLAFTDDSLTASRIATGRTTVG